MQRLRQQQMVYDVGVRVFILNRSCIQGETEKMIDYLYSAEGVSADQLHGFFAGWPNPPSRETHLRLLQQSDEVVLALDTSTGMIVGFITAMTDHVLAAYIPLLEVLPEYQGRQIGKTLVQKMLERLGNYYMVDLLCDPDLQPFYAQFGMQRATGMFFRNYDKQAGQSS